MSIILDFYNIVFYSTRELVQQERAKYSNSSRTLLLRDCLGVHSHTIFETGLPAGLDVNNPEPMEPLFSALRARLWRTRELVSLQSFRRWFDLLPLNATTFPLLSAVMAQEQDLPVIQHIGDILAWHAVLFSVFKPGSITREEVRNDFRVYDRGRGDTGIVFTVFVFMPE